MGRTIKNGRFCIYNGNEFKVNRDSDGNTIILTKNDKIIDATFKTPEEVNRTAFEKNEKENEEKQKKGLKVALF